MKLLIVTVMLFASNLFADESLKAMNLAPETKPAVAPSQAPAQKLPAKKVAKPAPKKKEGAHISVGVSTASAQDVVASPAPAASPVVAPAPADEQPHFLDAVLKLMKNSAGFVAGLLALFEILMRVFPTKKPKSFLVPAKYAIDGAVEILYFISNSILLPMINTANKSEEKVQKSA